MKICPQCHLSFDDSANACAKCGGPLTFVNVQPTPAAPSTDHTAEFSKKDISDNKILAMLPYLMGWIGIIIVLLASGSSPYAGFHVRQALKIQVVATLSVFLCIIPILGWIAFGIWAAITFVIQLICFFSVCKGQAKEPPIISSFGFLK